MDQLNLSNQLCFPLYAASREIIKRYTPLLEKIGLTYTQYIVMLVLWEKKQIGAKQLGELLFLDSGTITPVVKKLEQMELISRSRGTIDERTMDIILTSKGEVLKKKALNIPAKLKQCISLDWEESATLYRLLYKILEGCKK